MFKTFYMSLVSNTSIKIKFLRKLKIYIHFMMFCFINFIIFLENIQKE